MQTTVAALTADLASLRDQVGTLSVDLFEKALLYIQSGWKEKFADIEGRNTALAAQTTQLTESYATVMRQLATHSERISDLEAQALTPPPKQQPITTHPKVDWDGKRDLPEDMYHCAPEFMKAAQPSPKLEQQVGEQAVNPYLLQLSVTGE